MNSTDIIKHLKRWTLASIIVEVKKHMEQGFEVYIEGDQRLTSKKPEYFELRVDGPYLRPMGGKGEYHALIEVNLLGDTTRDDKNRYKHQNMQGLLAFILNRDFCIYKIGNEARLPEIDDGTLFDVFRLLPSDQIKVSDFGQIDPNTQVSQCSVEAHYEMNFSL